MQIHSTSLEGLIIIEPDIYTDERGYFFESFQRNKYSFLSQETAFVQDNEALSEYGVIRGLHYQIPPYGQAKLVRAITGTILDVVVDIRPDSKTYGQHFSILLSGDNKKQLYVPEGFAHGYAVLSKHAIFSYKCSKFYKPEYEGGIFYADPKLAIDWQIPGDQAILSEKDIKLAAFGKHRPYN